MHREKRRHRHEATEFIKRCSIVINRHAGRQAGKYVRRSNFSQKRIICIGHTILMYIHLPCTCKSEDEMREKTTETHTTDINGRLQHTSA